MCRKVNCSPCGFTRVQFRDVGFFQVRLCSPAHELGSSGSFGFAWIHFGAPMGCRIHPVLCGFTRVVVGLIVDSGSSGFAGAFRGLIGVT